MTTSFMELTEHNAVREVVGVKEDEARAFQTRLLHDHSVPWETYLSAGVLADRDVQMIRRFDKRDKFTQAALWEKACRRTLEGSFRRLTGAPAGGQRVRSRLPHRAAQREQGRHDAVRAGNAGRGACRYAIPRRTTDCSGTPLRTAGARCGTPVGWAGTGAWWQLVGGAK